MAKKEVDDPSKVANSTFNMTPMIDVVFQLIVVFLCSMKFRTLDQKIQAFLPKDVGLSAAPAKSTEDVAKVSVRLRRKAGEATTRVIVLDSAIGTTDKEGVWGALQSKLREFMSKDAKVKGEIDAEADVPHGEVVRTLDTFVAAGLTDVVFKGTQLNKSGTFTQQKPVRR
jgi:biopolymer transport protein ExbD